MYKIFIFLFLVMQGCFGLVRVQIGLILIASPTTILHAYARGCKNILYGIVKTNTIFHDT